VAARVLGELFAHASRRTRAAAVIAAVIACAGRLAVVWTALRIADGDARGAAEAGVVTAALFAFSRLVLAPARVSAECDFHRAAARALLEGDVLSVPTRDLERVIFESNHAARGLVVDLTPQLVADVVAAFLIAPVLARAFPTRVLVVSGVALFAVLATLLVLRRFTERLQDQVLEAYQEVADTVLVAVDGRLELVARGGEAGFSTTLDRALSRYARLSSRAGFGSALLGRAPLAIGVLVVGLIVLVDASSREAVAATAVAQALLVAAAMPPLLGVVFGLHQLARGRAQVRPLLEILRAPRRADLARRGRGVPALPASFEGEQVSFAYGAETARVLEKLSFAWPVDRPLVLTGPNGSGKSTLLRLLVALRAPSRGTLRVAGEDLEGIDAVGMRRAVAYLPQRAYLGEGYRSVRDAVRLAKPDADDDAIRAALERTAVLSMLHDRGVDALDVRVGELSAGQRQRVALARVLLQDSSVVLLDEPDANLDRDGIALVASLVEELGRRGAMVAVAAHTRELAEMASAVRIDLGSPSAARRAGSSG
jgi:ABC-type bacteriocin/lantibiotic exporter with double-glycine peptidase domain